VKYFSLLYCNHLEEMNDVVVIFNSPLLQWLQNGGPWGAMVSEPEKIVIGKNRVVDQSTRCGRNRERAKTKQTNKTIEQNTKKETKTT